jgi:hypothetical protein
MMTYSKANKKSIENAVAKAKSVKPLARVVGYGRFLVAGSKPGVRYEVRFSADSQGELVVECECQANSKKGSACYHAAAVAGLYKGQWTARREREEAAAEAASIQPAVAVEQAPADYMFLSDEDVASGQWGEPMTEQEAIAAGKCAKKWCDRLAEAGAYCDECALELAHDRACLFGN